MRRRCWTLLVYVGTLWPLAGCGSRELTVKDAEAFPARFGAIRERILTPRCVNCHAKLVSFKAVRDELVVPGHAEQSVLYTITQSGEMPKYGSPLEQPELDALKAWIDGGAHDD